MIVYCPGCSKKYEIPNDRLPKKKMASFTCPECKGTVKLNLEDKIILNAPAYRHGEQAPVQKSDFAAKDKEADALKNAILQTMNDLPPMPQVISKIREIMLNPRSNFKDIAQVIEKDQAIAALILKTANSAYYGMTGKVSSIHQASVILGYDTLNEILTIVGASALLGKKLKGYNMDSGTLWRHSLAVAIAARIIAAKRHPAIENEAFSAGLIHDSGKLVLNKYLFVKKNIFEKKLNKHKNNTTKAEKETLGFDHTEIASGLCKKWHIPDEQNIAIRYHHYPSQSSGCRMAYILHAADLTAAMQIIGIEGFMEKVEDGVMDYLNFVPEDMEGIAQEVNLAVEKMTGSL